MIHRCKELNGQGECRICKEEGKYSITWMELLYRVDGNDGYYCYKHANEIDKQK